MRAAICRGWHCCHSLFAIVTHFFLIPILWFSFLFEVFLHALFKVFRICICHCQSLFRAPNFRSKVNFFLPLLFGTAMKYNTLQSHETVKKFIYSFTVTTSGTYGTRSRPPVVWKESIWNAKRLSIKYSRTSFSLKASESRSYPLNFNCKS